MVARKKNRGSMSHAEFKKLPVRLHRKGKTVGRPSAADLYLRSMSAAVSEHFSKPAVRQAIDAMATDLMLYGHGAIVMPSPNDYGASPAMAAMPLVKSVSLLDQLKYFKVKNPANYIRKRPKPLKKRSRR